MRRFRSSWNKAGAVSLAAVLLSTAAQAETGVRPSPDAACAALDLHLLWEVEDAATGRAVPPEELLATVEGALAARKLCRDGKVAEAVATYDRLDLGPSLVRWLR